MDYFRNMFTSSNPFLIDQALVDFEPRVTSDMNYVLKKDYTGEEIQVALSQMHPIKAPGPMFFQIYWHIVGH